MTDPITLTERERLVWHQLARALDPGDVRVAPARAHLATAIKDWLASQPAESASPPRVPGASAQDVTVGVESGPGQPMPPYTPDIAQGLDEWAAKYSEPEDVRARCLREAAAEIRRLRVELAEEKLSYAEAWAGRFRAGIEAALDAIETMLVTPSRSAPQYEVLHEAFDTIRALADKPAPDAARKGG